MAVLWEDIDVDLSASSRHFGLAVELFDAGFDRGTEKIYYFQTMGSMHAMLAGYTSFEAGMKRLMSMLDEPLPTSYDSHAALVRRLAGPVSGSRPAVLDRAGLIKAVEGLRGFDMSPLTPTTRSTRTGQDWRSATRRCSWRTFVRPSIVSGPRSIPTSRSWPP